MSKETPEQLRQRLRQSITDQLAAEVIEWLDGILDDPEAESAGQLVFFYHCRHIEVRAGIAFTNHGERYLRKLGSMGPNTVVKGRGDPTKEHVDAEQDH